MKTCYRIVSHVVLYLILFCIIPLRVTAEEGIATIHFTKVICKEPGRYIGWPSITVTREGQLIAVFSGDRDAHVCPWGKTQMVRSGDGGRYWTQPVVINNTPLDDRDAGIIETHEGTFLVSWFTSLAFEKYSGDPQYLRHGEKLTPALREEWLGHWVRRSEDGGETWGPYIRTTGSTPHGPIQLRDGRLLYVGKGIYDKDGTYANTVEESLDDGRTWKIIATIAIPPGEEMSHYHEPHVVELTNGKLVALFRYQPADKSQCFLRQTESTDGGRTWSVCHATPIWGYPPHLIQLENGWLVVVYGRRIPPYGERACISRDGGKTWDVEHEIILCDARNDDLGYPASVQLDDGSIFTVFYQQDGIDDKTCLMGTRWELK